MSKLSETISKLYPRPSSIMPGDRPGDPTICEDPSHNDPSIQLLVPCCEPAPCGAPIKRGYLEEHKETCYKCLALAQENGK